MDKLKVVLKTALKSKRFYAGVALVVGSLGFASGEQTVTVLTDLFCTLAGGCTP